MPYANLAGVARKLMMMTADLQPPAYASLDHARELVQRVLTAVFVPLTHLDGGPREHAFWATVASLHAYREGARKQYQHDKHATAGQLAEGQTLPTPEDLDDAELVRLYRSFLTRYETELSESEVALAVSLGAPGIHLLMPNAPKKNLEETDDEDRE
jgi:hypothetical protein